MYTKIIQSGKILEVFEYEKEPQKKAIFKKPRFQNTRKCRRSVQRARISFVRLLQANLSTGTAPIFLTLTMREIVPIKDAWREFTLFAQRLRNKVPRVVYVAVPEFQKRGAVHFHLLVWNLPNVTITSERSTRTIAELWGNGFIDIVRTDGSPKLASYMAKYMFKAVYDERLYNSRLYSASRSVVRSVSIKSPAAISYIKDEFKLSDSAVDSFVEYKSEYDTVWLGRCKYYKYNFSLNYEGTSRRNRIYNTQIKSR